MGTKKEVPEIPFNAQDRHLWTEKLHKEHKEEESIRRHFTLPIITYVGSDLNCGCGFRHISILDDNNLIYDDPKEADKAKNHRELLAFIKENLGDQDRIELYAVWEGKWDKLPKHKEEIDAAQLVDDDFCFREPGFYTVKNIR